MPLSREGSQSPQQAVNGGTEWVVFGFRRGAGVDQAGAICVGQQASKRSLPVDGDVLAVDQDVVVEGDDLDARIAIGSRADGSVVPFKAAI